LSQDYPSLPVNPFAHLHAAVTRSEVGESHILGPECEKLTVAAFLFPYLPWPRGPSLTGRSSRDGHLGA